MTSTRNWSSNSFERAMEQLCPFITPDWLQEMRIVPVNYSEWSDTIYVEVHLRFNRRGEEIILGLSPSQKDDLTYQFGSYIRSYVGLLLNTNILVKTYKRQDETNFQYY